MKKLSGKTALIIGGSRGIGFATAKLFNKEGATVIITGRDLDDLNKAAQEIGDKISIIQSDAGKLVDIKRLFLSLSEEKITLDNVFINAGIAEGGHIDDASEDTFDRQFDINFKGAYFIAKESVRLLKRHASIIFTSSIAGFMGIKNLSIYSATKAALLNLTETLAADLAERSIRVNAISPGAVETPLSMKNNRERYLEICHSIPFEQRFGQPEEVAQVALFLASDMASYVTGANIVVDGGLSCIRLKV